jgi:hypothetical protein
MKGIAMTRRWKVFAGLTLIGSLFVSAISTLGQQRQATGSSGTVVIERQRPDAPAPPAGPPPMPPPGDTFVFIASEMSFDGKLVKGAPYSAQAVTESTQTLADGNRIVNKSTSSVYRDSEGRTRREQTVHLIGPFAAGEDAPQTVFISDPVAGVSYTFDSRSRTARKMPPMRFKFSTTADGASGEVQSGNFVFERVPEPGTAMRGVPPPEGVASQIFTYKVPGPGGSGGDVMITREGGRRDNVVTESLGKQFIEGLEAEGTRNTVTIPAGEIGNERPIQIINERWYSPELQTIVMTRHSDPRFGETVYRLTNISRSEPARSLFEVPADYTITEGPPLQPLRLAKPAPPPKP